MPYITVSEGIHAAVTEFKQVVEAVIGEEIRLDYCVELILNEGTNSMLKDLLGSSDAPTLLASLQQLGSKHPTQSFTQGARFSTSRYAVSICQPCDGRVTQSQYQENRRRPDEEIQGPSFRQQIPNRHCAEGVQPLPQILVVPGRSGAPPTLPLRFDSHCEARFPRIVDEI